MSRYINKKTTGKLYNEIHHPRAILMMFIKPALADIVGRFYNLTDGKEVTFNWDYVLTELSTPMRKYRHRIIQNSFKVKIWNT
jgi:hypothetical protein